MTNVKEETRILTIAHNLEIISQSINDDNADLMLATAINLIDMMSLSRMNFEKMFFYFEKELKKQNLNWVSNLLREDKRKNNSLDNSLLDKLEHTTYTFANNFDYSFPTSQQAKTIVNNFHDDLVELVQLVTTGKR